MSDQYILEGLELLENEKLTSRSVLLLSGVTAIPHLSLIVDDQVHSLSVKGYSVKSLESVIHAHKRKEIPCLFIRIDVPLNTKNVLETFSSFAKVESEGASCLHPIRACLTNSTGIAFESCEIVFDLLDLLKEYSLIEGRYYLNLTGLINANSFALQKYSRSQVDENIGFELKKLERAKL